MKYSPSILIILSLFISNIVFAQQQLDYKVSEPYKVIDAYSKRYFSNTSTGKMLSIKRDRHYLHMQSFDANRMKEIRREKIKLKDFPKGFQIETITWINKRLFLLYSAYDKRAKLTSVYVREVDFDKCSFKGSDKKIIESKGSLGYNSYAFLFSKDKSKLLVWARLRPEKKRDAINYDKIEMFVFGEGMNKIAQNVITMPYTEQKMDNIDYHIDAKGTVYLLAKVREGNLKSDVKKNGKERSANYHLELLTIDVKAKKIKNSKIEVDQYFIKDIWLFEGQDDQIICSGFYNKKGDGWVWSSRISEGNADGIFVFKMDEDGELKDKYFYEIPIEIINQYKTAAAQKRNKKKEEKGKADFASLVLRKLIIQDDNSILIIGEQYFVVSHTYTDSNGNMRTRYSYHFYDILVTKIGSDGKLAWMRKLPKRQIGGTPAGGLGFKYMNIDGKHYFLYLDNVKNMELPLDKAPAVHRDGRGGFLTAYKLDDDAGKVRKVSIFDTKDVKGYKVYQFSPNRILPVSEDEFLVEFYKKGKQDIMVKVKVD